MVHQDGGDNELKDNNEKNDTNIPHDAHDTPNMSPPSNKTKMTPKNKKANIPIPKLSNTTQRPTSTPQK